VVRIYSEKQVFADLYYGPGQMNANGAGRGEFFRRSVLVCAVLAIPITAAANQGSKKAGKLRQYADGPLTAADFAGKAPEQSPINMGIEMVANTECEVRYEYRAALQQRAPELWTARITSFTCTAVVVPGKCWNTQPESRRVLYHEQGHFDLAEIAARRTQRHFAGLMRERKESASGRDRRAAERKLDQEIKKAMQEVYDGLAKAQKTYDEETRHGTAILPQSRHREWQRAELEKLTAAK
jgi:hypothetical protein